jgi:lambda family phage tail tape measure protein
MAKIGGMSADSLEMVSTTAKALKTAFDIPIADTVKKFKELQEKPTESLTKLAVQLGTIPVEVLKQVDAYERAGNSIKAAELATTAYAKAGKDAADAVVKDFGVITRLGISIKEIWDSTWDSIMGIGRKGTLEEQITKIRESLPTLRSKVSPDADVNDYDAQQLEAAESQLRALLAQASAEKNLAVEKKANADAAAKFEDDKKKRDEAANKLKSDANKLEQSYANELEKARETYIGQIGALDHLTKAEITLNKVRTSPEWSKYTEAQRKNIESLYNAASANERLVQSEKDTEAALELKNKLLGKSEGLGKEYYKTIELINKYAAAGKFGADEVLQLKAALEATTPEAKRLAAAQAENAKVMQGIAAERASVADQYSGDFKTADEKAAIKSVSDYKKKTAQADIEYQKQVASAGKNITDGELEMYKAQADAKKLLAQEALDREQYVLSEGYKRQQAYADAFQGLFNGMADAIVEFARTGKLNFSDLIDTMLADLLRFELRQQMMQAYQATGGGANILTSIIGAFSGSATPSAKGNVFNGGLQAFAKGGSFTNGIVNSPTMFNMGLMGEAGPEAIMPLRRGSDGSLGVAATGSSGGNVSVQVINNSNAHATTNETTDSKGNRKVEVIIGEMTAGEISRSGSSSQKSIKSTFGIQPQLIRR